MPVIDGSTRAKIYFGSTNPATIGIATKGNKLSIGKKQFYVHHAIVSAVKRAEFVSDGFHI
jgi:hypothetical protein